MGIQPTLRNSTPSRFADENDDSPIEVPSARRTTTVAPDSHRGDRWDEPSDVYRSARPWASAAGLTATNFHDRNDFDEFDTRFISTVAFGVDEWPPSTLAVLTSHRTRHRSAAKPALVSPSSASRAIPNPC